MAITQVRLVVAMLQETNRCVWSGKPACDAVCGVLRDGLG